MQNKIVKKINKALELNGIPEEDCFIIKLKNDTMEFTGDIDESEQVFVYENLTEEDLAEMKYIEDFVEIAQCIDWLPRNLLKKYNIKTEDYILLVLVK